MRKQAVNQTFENNSMEGALAALGKSIARWTEKGAQLMTAIPGLSLYWMDWALRPYAVLPGFNLTRPRPA